MTSKLFIRSIKIGSIDGLRNKNKSPGEDLITREVSSHTDGAKVTKLVHTSIPSLLVRHELLHAFP